MTRIGDEFTRLKKKMTTDLKNGIIQQLHCHTILNKVIEECSCIKIKNKQRKGKIWDQTIHRRCTRIHCMCARFFIIRVHRVLEANYEAMSIRV